MDIKRKEVILFEIIYWVGIILLFIGFILDKLILISIAILFTMLSLFEDHKENLKNLAKFQFILFYILGAILVILSLNFGSLKALFTGVIIIIISIISFRRPKIHFDHKNLESHKFSIAHIHKTPKVKLKIEKPKVNFFKRLFSFKRKSSKVIQPKIKLKTKPLESKNLRKIILAPFILVYIVVIILILASFYSNNLYIIIVSLFITIINFLLSLKKHLIKKRSLFRVPKKEVKNLKENLESRKEKIILKKPEIQMPIKRRLPITQIKNLVKQKSQYQTDIDLLYLLLKEYKLIKLSEIVEIFGITKEKAEEWALILEESNLAILHYPAMGETELRAKA